MGPEAFVQAAQAAAGRHTLEALMGLREAARGLHEADPAALLAALGALDPAQHSLGSLLVLRALLAGPNPPPEALQKAGQFLRACDPAAAKLDHPRFVDIARKLREQATLSGQPKSAVLPLLHGLRKLQPSSEVLTPLHGDFFQVCLLAKCHHAAAKVLDDDIYDVAPDVTGTTPRDFMLYAYYGGLLRAGRKEYQQALDLFKHAITLPATAVSAIAVAAYQKFALISLVLHGSNPPLPKCTSTPLLRYLKSECNAYQELVQAYNSRSSASLSSAAAQHQDTFKADGNWGLVGLVMESLQRRNIMRLTHTHLTLSLQGIADAAKLSGPEEAEAWIVKMVDKGEIFATINQQAAMVSFNEDSEQYRSLKVAEALDAQIQRSVVLDTKVKAANEAISCDRAYLSRVSLRERMFPPAARAPTEDEDEDKSGPLAPAYGL